MMYLRIVEGRLTGERWLQFALPDSLNDEDDRALLAFARRFLQARDEAKAERRWAKAFLARTRARSKSLFPRDPPRSNRNPPRSNRNT